MSTPHEIAAQRTRRMIVVLIVLVVVLALSLAVAVGFALGSGGADRPGKAAPSSAAPSPSSAAAGDILKLPEGGDQVDGRYPVNFAETPEGAVALATAYFSNDVTLDPEVKARTRQIYAQEVHGTDLQELTEDARMTIELYLEKYGFGMTLEELPEQASMSALPMAVVYEQVDERTVDVALLVQVSAHDGISRRTTFMESPGVRCVWEQDLRGGDWALSSEFPDIEAPEQVEPHTAAFENSEWIKLQGGVS